LISKKVKTRAKQKKGKTEKKKTAGKETGLKIPTRKFEKKRRVDGGAKREGGI